jgi:ubiquinone/menaquinone biosynthesis C-methylase UbiE
VPLFIARLVFFIAGVDSDFLLLKIWCNNAWQEIEVQPHPKDIEMDITKIDPEAALFASHAHHRASKGYFGQLVSWAPTDAARVLDVGSGTGTLALQLADRASFVVGIDSSLTMVELARRSQSESRKTNVAWVIASADALPFPAATFDYITSTYALRFSNLDRSLPEMRRTITPGGRIAIRDLVPRAPRFGFWLDHCRSIIHVLPRLLRLYGWRGAWRMVAYKLTAAGAQRARESRRLDPISFMETFARYFPEQESRFVFSPGKLFWVENAAEHRDSRNKTNHNIASKA